MATSGEPTPQSPPPSSANDRNAAADTHALREFLATRNEACPACGYNLRGLTQDRCPECGARLVLQLADAARPLSRAAVAGFVGWSFDATLLGLMTVRYATEGSWAAAGTLVGLIYCVAQIRAWGGRAALLDTLPARKRREAAAPPWIVAILLSIWFLLG